MRIVAVFAVAALAVADGETCSEEHYAHRRSQQDEDCPVQRALRGLGSGFRIGVAHGATLGEGRSSPAAEKQEQCRDTPFGSEIHGSCHFTPRLTIRPASGKKKKYMMMKQATTEKVSIQRIRAFSNFRCMK